MADKDYPVGVAQQKVLDVLGLTATGYGDASDKFMNLGLVVASKRGTPIVRYHPTRGGIAEDETVKKLAQWFDRGY